MKSLYPLAATVLALLTLCLEASAQYTAVRNGNWGDTGPTTPWDPSGKPSDICNACTITINSGVTVTLNRHVTLAAGSLLKIGTDGSGAALLQIPPSGGTDWASSNNLILPNDGSSPANRIQLATSSSFISATSAGTYDGVLTSFSSSPTIYFKQIGRAPQGFSGTTVINNAPASYGTSLTGPSTLSATGTLPIILVDFQAVLVGKSQVELTWTTQLEINSDHFGIERNTDGSRWETIGTVAARGNTSVAVEYSFTDFNPSTGVSEYRLRSVDQDGKYAYSPVKVINRRLVSGLSMFPNPAKDYVNISFGNEANGSLHIRLLSPSGQVLTEKHLNGAAGTTVSLPVSGFPQGDYLILITGADGSRQVSKLLISRQ